ncbi:unnamed protein product [Phytophthora fragariaefolia]|uniref:Unnamed protein product n=1 Tax=Phytophthora fragariaefolia TaxID=1490495 RepID=A0A9W6XN57_9STRA|nr:unnamed protein product [Phytophthora fragariaefolia]
MVWMCKEGLAAGIVTEDSDVVVYCLTANVSSPVLVKLEDNGSAQTAVKHIFNYRGAPAHLRVQRLVSKLSSSGTKIPDEFMQQFMKAETIFYHHIVFNPKKRSCEFLINERHGNCFPDILQCAKESLGIASTEDKVDLASIPQQQDLHASATSTKSFLGQICSRDIVEQIYNGELCPRTLRGSAESPTSSQTAQTSGGYQAGYNPVAGLPIDGDGFDDHVGKTRQPAFHAAVVRPAVNKPSPAVIAQQLENRKRAQALERESSLKSLMSIYNAAAATAPTASSTNDEGQSLTSATRTIVSDLKHSNEGKVASLANASAAPSVHALSSTATVFKAKVTATSMKDLVKKHSQSVQASKSPEAQAPVPKVVPQSAPESRKRPRPGLSKPVVNSARKARAVASKSSATSGRKTLLDFFKQA